MQVIQILNQNNQVLNVQAIRYFKLDDKKYFVFSLNEIDEQGYIKVYVSKVLGLNGTIAAYDIIDETEWAKVKEIIKAIIKANREGSMVPVSDLSMDTLNNIKVNGEQVFKLLNNLIQLLSANIRVVEEPVVSDSGLLDSTIIEQPVAPVETVDSMVDSVPVVNSEPLVNVVTEPIPTDTPSVEAQSEVEPVVSENVVTDEGSSSGGDGKPVPEPVNNGINDEYKTLYLEQLQKNEQLMEEITRYKAQLDSIKAILG